MKLETITALEKLYNLLFGFVAIRPSVRSQISEKLEILAPSLTVFVIHYLNINWNVNEEDGTPNTVWQRSGLSGPFIKKKKMAHIFKLPQKTSQLVEKISQMIFSESRAFDLEPLFSIFCCLKIARPRPLS